MKNKIKNFFVKLSKGIIVALPIIFLVVVLVFMIMFITKFPKMEQEIDFLKGKIYDLENHSTKLQEELELQRDVFSAYVNGQLVE